jgi:hypothetical protein
LKVPPGPDPELEPGDIRVAWDLKKNGVNDKMYTPSFSMPTLGTYLRRIEAGTFAGDFDVGEQFHSQYCQESEVLVPPILENNHSRTSDYRE